MIGKPIPYRKQETSVYCGPAIVQMILAAYGKELSQGSIAREMGTDEQGTPVARIEDFLGSHGFEVQRKNGADWDDIISALGAGSIVVVGYIEPSDEKAHYSIAVSTTDHVVSLLDPWFGEEHILLRDEFIKRWRDDADEAYGERMMMAVSMPQ